MISNLYKKRIDYKSLVDLLIEHTEKDSSKVAFTFLEDGEDKEVNLTYEELNSTNKRIAAYLQSQNLIGKRILIMYPFGLEYIKVFLGCLYAGCIPVPVYPPSLSRNLLRLKSIMKDAETSIILTNSNLLSKIDRRFSDEVIDMDIQWICIDNVHLPESNLWRRPQITGDSIAFLQYTSGSTGNPKGVKISHNNILYNELIMKNTCNHGEDTIMLGWLPLYHDMGLIGNVLHSLYLGATCILLSPMAFLQKPIRWLQAMSKYNANVSGGPNFAYDLCVKKVTEQEKKNLDLSNWNVAFNGSEPIHYKTMKEFSDYFRECGFNSKSFYPCYGMAEATLFISGNTKLQGPKFKSFDIESLKENKVREVSELSENSKLLVGCGEPRPQNSVLIVNPDSKNICSLDEIGEIWVKSSSVSPGYFGKKEETDYTFNGTLSNSGKSGYLRTGDLGFLNNNQLFVTGRLKDIIIIKGKNYYPQDLELITEEAHVAIRSGFSAAFTIEVGTEEKLIIVAEVERSYRVREKNANEQKIKLREVSSLVRQKVMEEHQIQPYQICLIKTGKIPKTSSGKIQRKACKQAFLENLFEDLTT